MTNKYNSLIPLELNIPLLKKFNMLTDNKPYIDISQIYNLLLGNNDLNYIYHDNATQIFSSIFNNNKLYAFEILIINLLQELLENKIRTQFYHVKKTHKKNSPYFISTINNITNDGTLDTNVNNNLGVKYESVIKNQNQYTLISPPFNFIQGVYVLCLFEYDEDDFGHYGAMFFDGKNIFV